MLPNPTTSPFIWYIPPEALPPSSQLSERQIAAAQAIADHLGAPQAHLDVLVIVRLGGALAMDGFATVLPGQTLAWPCELALAFARRAGCVIVPPFLLVVDAALRNSGLRQTYPEWLDRPKPNDNWFYDVHSGLATALSYAYVVTDLQAGIKALLDRAHWRRTPKARHSLDAALTALFRIVPALNTDRLARALATHNTASIAEVFYSAGASLKYERNRQKFLPSTTVADYLRDCCRALNHPEWGKAAKSLLPLGNRSMPARSHQSTSWPTDDDDPPEHSDAPDRFRESHLAKIETQVRRDLEPTAVFDDSLIQAATAAGWRHYAEEHAVMHEYSHLAHWWSAYWNELGELMASIFKGTSGGSPARLATLDTDRLQRRVALLSLIFLGRPFQWLCTIRNGVPLDLHSFKPEMPPVYVPEWDAIGYWPETIPELPTKVIGAEDLFETISPGWLLPLPHLLIPWCRELASRRGASARLFTLSETQLKATLRDVTEIQRRDVEHRPALTEGRLRAAYRSLMEQTAHLDPLLAAMISGQWRPALRVSLYYATPSVRLLGQRSREAVDQIWTALRADNPSLGELYRVEPSPVPDIRMGSPYCPRTEVLLQHIAILKTAVAQAQDDESRHNARTLLALDGLNYLAGCRFTEVTGRTATDFDLEWSWVGEFLPILVLPDTKGNRWTTAARLVPIADCVVDLLRFVLETDHGRPALHFLERGQPVAATQDEIRRRLSLLGIAFPRWNAGRHWVRTQALEAGIPFDVIGACLGHQSSGREFCGPYSTLDPGMAWSTFRRFSNTLARRLHWSD